MHKKPNTKIQIYKFTIFTPRSYHTSNWLYGQNPFFLTFSYSRFELYDGCIHQKHPQKHPNDVRGHRNGRGISTSCSPCSSRPRTDRIGVNTSPPTSTAPWTHHITYYSPSPWPDCIIGRHPVNNTHRELGILDVIEYSDPLGSGRHRPARVRTAGKRDDFRAATHDPRAVPFWRGGHQPIRNKDYERLPVTVYSRAPPSRRPNRSAVRSGKPYSQCKGNC